MSRANFEARVITSMPGVALAEEHGKQFLVAECLRAFAQEFLARAVDLGDVVDCLAHGFRQRGTNGSE